MIAGMVVVHKSVLFSWSMASIPGRKTMVFVCWQLLAAFAMTDCKSVAAKGITASRRTIGSRRDHASTTTGRYAVKKNSTYH